MRDPMPAPPFLVSLSTPLAQKYSLTTLPNHVHEILLGFLWYHFILYILSPTLSRLLVPKTYNGFNRRTRLNWDIHWVSMVQAVFINTAAVWVIARDGERARMDWAGRLWGYTGASGWVQGWAAGLFSQCGETYNFLDVVLTKTYEGYFLWDLMISGMYLDVAGISALLHAIGALAVTMIGFRPFGNYYGLSFILYELSTPFLNIHWFCDKLGYTGSRLQLYNGIALLFTFFLCRLVWGTWQSVLIYSDIYTAFTSPDAGLQSAMMREMGMGVGGEKCDGRSAAGVTAGDVAKGLGGVESAMGCHVGELPAWLVAVYLLGNTALSLLNFYWFAQMVKAVRKRFVTNEKTGKGKWANGKANGNGTVEGKKGQ
ncbi:TLC domain-domain-containing protein [Clohesyomyces aquaticus]|uniref:TLC domain-domain-containing protein n=1 Tax=Clohesyomyces aquaticus TaxID=1231657 RepID=A0A1Y1Y8G6_9PLEO|nr:TLC domain-domain-containing protein [Clohesyomyces aquaticus]